MEIERIKPEFEAFMKHRRIKNEEYIPDLDGPDREYITLWEFYNLDNIWDGHLKMAKEVFDIAWKHGYFFSAGSK